MVKKVLVTGANRGIGLEFCRQYQADGWEVTAVCRGSSPALRELGVRIIEEVDVSSPDQLKKLAQQLSAQTFDVLINNAGVWSEETLGEVTVPEWSRVMAVNGLGPILVTQALLANLSSGSKIAMVTSRMGSIEDNTMGGYYAYRMSKAALNAGAKSLALDLKNQGIAVVILHPGYVITDMTNRLGDLTPQQSVTGMRQRIEELTMATSGGFFHTNGEKLPW
ncbi:MAG: SDR family oxidoreductase [Bdellovibrionaceae bacterium]|nr:SDR family oxidoreductase [Bdellovibrionales bacterium]MCB9084416.1 SDR family oxidoreductase [Pseudobdellovibrionaceae bacterium]